MSEDVLVNLAPGRLTAPGGLRVASAPARGGAEEFTSNSHDTGHKAGLMPGVTDLETAFGGDRAAR
jgi:hypothetical protein